MTHPIIKLMLFALLMALPAACSQTPRPAPGTRVVYQDVVREVQRPCPVAIPQRPAPLARPLPDSPARLVDLLTAKLKEWAGEGGYGDRADAALHTCTEE